MRISDWSSDVCSSDLDVSVSKRAQERAQRRGGPHAREQPWHPAVAQHVQVVDAVGSGEHPRNHAGCLDRRVRRSEEHTSELQSLMRISYAVFCLNKKKRHRTNTHIPMT